MMSPCEVTDWLNSDPLSSPVPPDSQRCARKTSAKSPPSSRKNIAVMMYITPTSLWLVVTSHRLSERRGGSSLISFHLRTRWSRRCRLTFLRRNYLSLGHCCLHCHRHCYFRCRSRCRPTVGKPRTTRTLRASNRPRAHLT